MLKIKTKIILKYFQHKYYNKNIYIIRFESYNCIGKKNIF